MISPFHTLSGLAAVRAVLADATGDIARQQSALDDYRLATAGECPNLDLTLGRSSVLLVAAILYARADPHWPAAQRLRTDGERLCRGIWRDLAQTAMPYNGIAHGWAGVAYASMIWAAACGVEPPAEVRAVLEMLAAAAEPHGRGARWPVTPLGGTCGRPALARLVPRQRRLCVSRNLAYASYRDDAYALLAERAAQLLDAGVGVSSLCCGSAGIAYAALSQYRATRDERWRAGALRIAEHSAEHDAIAGDAASPLSLYKGYAGLALLAAELERPERAAMPLFEPEPPVVHHRAVPSRNWGGCDRCAASARGLCSHCGRERNQQVNRHDGRIVRQKPAEEPIEDLEAPARAQQDVTGGSRLLRPQL